MKTFYLPISQYHPILEEEEGGGAPSREAEKEGRGGNSGWSRASTHSLDICTTFSMAVYPATMKCSVYCCILMLSSHSDTVRKGTPSEPLVLGSRMDTLGWKSTGHR